MQELATAQFGAEKQTSRFAYEKALEMAAALRKNESFSVEAFDKLQRYMSDCLPWSDPVLDAWNQLCRVVRRMSV